MEHAAPVASLVAPPPLEPSLVVSRAVWSALVSQFLEAETAAELLDGDIDQMKFCLRSCCAGRGDRVHDERPTAEDLRDQLTLLREYIHTVDPQALEDAERANHKHIVLETETPDTDENEAEEAEESDGERPPKREREPADGPEPDDAAAKKALVDPAA